MEEKDRSKKRERRIALIIVLIGLCISGIILLLPGWIGANQSNGEPTAVGIPEGSAAESTEPPASYTVSFYDETGAPLESTVVTGGDPVIPPEIPMQSGYVFKGWSESLFQVEGDLNVYPVFESVADKKNAIVGNAVYGTDSFVLQLNLDGQVDCCDFQIELAYDTKLLQLEAAKPLLKGLTAEHDPETGTITLKWSSDTAVTEPNALAELRFHCEQAGLYRTNLATVTEEIHTFDGTTRIYTDSTAYDAEIMILN